MFKTKTDKLATELFVYAFKQQPEKKLVSAYQLYQSRLLELLNEHQIEHIVAYFSEMLQIVPFKMLLETSFIDELLKFKESEPCIVSLLGRLSGGLDEIDRDHLRKFVDAVAPKVQTKYKSLSALLPMF